MDWAILLYMVHQVLKLREVDGWAALLVHSIEGWLVWVLLSFAALIVLFWALHSFLSFYNGTVQAWIRSTLVAAILDFCILVCLLVCHNVGIVGYRLFSAQDIIECGCPICLISTILLSRCRHGQRFRLAPAPVDSRVRDLAILASLSFASLRKLRMTSAFDLYYFLVGLYHELNGVWCHRSLISSLINFCRCICIYISLSISCSVVTIVFKRLLLRHERRFWSPFKHFLASQHRLLLVVWDGNCSITCAVCLYPVRVLSGRHHVSMEELGCFARSIRLLLPMAPNPPLDSPVFQPLFHSLYLVDLKLSWHVELLG